MRRGVRSFLSSKQCGISLAQLRVVEACSMVPMAPDGLVTEDRVPPTDIDPHTRRTLATAA